DRLVQWDLVEWNLPAVLHRGGRVVGTSGFFFHRGTPNGCRPYADISPVCEGGPLPSTGYGPYRCGVTGVTVHIPLLGTSRRERRCRYTLRDDHPHVVLTVGVAGVRAGRRHGDRAPVRD